MKNHLNVFFFLVVIVEVFVTHTFLYVMLCLPNHKIVCDFKYFMKIKFLSKINCIRFALLRDISETGDNSFQTQRMIYLIEMLECEHHQWCISFYAQLTQKTINKTIASHVVYSSRSCHGNNNNKPRKKNYKAHSMLIMVISNFIAIKGAFALMKCIRIPSCLREKIE